MCLLWGKCDDEKRRRRAGEGVTHTSYTGGVDEGEVAWRGFFFISLFFGVGDYLIFAKNNLIYSAREF